MYSNLSHEEIFLGAKYVVKLQTEEKIMSYYVANQKQQSKSSRGG